jgi:hypothetical protein
MSPAQECERWAKTGQSVACSLVGRSRTQAQHRGSTSSPVWVQRAAELVDAERRARKRNWCKSWGTPSAPDSPRDLRAPACPAPTHRHVFSRCVCSPLSSFSLVNAFRTPARCCSSGPTQERFAPSLGLPNRAHAASGSDLSLPAAPSVPAAPAKAVSPVGLPVRPQLSN